MGDTTSDGGATERATSSSGTNEAKMTTEQLTRGVQMSLVKVIRDANGLPKRSKGFELFSSYSAYAKFLREQQSRVLLTLRRVLRSAGCRVHVPNRVEDLEEFWDRLVEANDFIADRVGIAMDKLSRQGRDIGRISTEEGAGVTDAAVVNAAVDKSKSMGRYAALLTRVPGYKPTTTTTSSPALIAPQFPTFDKVSAKPQITYAIAVDNSYEPFVSKLKVKHHSRPSANSNLTIRDEGADECGTQWTAEEYTDVHPYQHELDNFEVPERQLERGEVAELKPLAETELVMVNTVERLRDLRDVLNSVQEFAVDLEHHSYRSFLGLTCLVQISTRTKDYVIDPFPIWNEMYILNEPFTDPNILKVFHGSDWDVEWLQRDFGIYLVNLFDTHRAMKVLNFERFSLLHLVNNLCGVLLDKELRKCDWRVRPLTAAHLEYARGDTHYLLHCYDKLRIRLFDEVSEVGSLLRGTYIESKMLCLKIYEKPEFEARGFEKLLRGRRKELNAQQQYAITELWKWRDERARSDDESLEYVLPSHMLLQIAEVLPREMQGILACCSPVPPLVKQELLALHRIVHAARDCFVEKRTTTVNFVIPTVSDGDPLERYRRINKTNALIRCGLDFTSTKFDEEIRVFDSTVEIAEASEEPPDGISKEVDGSGGAQKVFEDRHVVIGATSDDKLTNTVEVKATAGKLDDWATPYERYQIWAKHEDEKQQKLRKEGKESETSTQEPEKKRWSHHDPSAVKLTHIEQKTEFSAIEVAEERRTREGEFVGIDSEMVLTKKALKNKRKHLKTKADVPYAGSEVPGKSAEEDGPTPEKRAKRKNWTDADELPADAAVNYDDYNSAMFKERPQQNAYDPFKGSGLGKKSNNKKFGKRRGGGFANSRGRGGFRGRPQKRN